MNEPLTQQLPMFPFYVANGESYGSLREAARALGTVTLDRAYELIRRPGSQRTFDLYKARASLIRKRTYRRDTLFHEIKVRPQETDDPIHSFLGRSFGTKKPADPDVMARDAVAALRSHVETLWDPDANHVVLHSSGYDTRLISALIRSLADEHGRDWLGHVTFACFQPEIERARAVFDHVWGGGGFDARWLPIYPDLDPDRYYASCLAFDQIGKLSEAERFWGGPFLTEGRLESEGFFDGKTQGVTALYSDETGKFNRRQWGTWGVFVGCHLLDAPGVFPTRSDVSWICPFAGLGYVEQLTEHRIPEGLDDWKLRMIRVLDADLAELPNFRFEIKPIRERNGGHIDQQKLHPDTIAAVEESYRSSWYAGAVGPAEVNYHDDPVFRYWDDRNCDYIKAAICESLIHEGFSIQIA